MYKVKYVMFKGSGTHLAVSAGYVEFVMWGFRCIYILTAQYYWGKCCQPMTLFLCPSAEVTPTLTL